VLISLHGSSGRLKLTSKRNSRGVALKQFTGEEARKYWQLVSSHCSHVDYVKDPDGLNIVCGISSPLWLNKYYARFQRVVFNKLFSLIEAQRGTPRALDIGCGAGRWCKFLAGQGYQTVGIDLQRDVVNTNRDRYGCHSNMEFVNSSIQDFDSNILFDLACSVTVIQHIPYEEQEIVIKKTRELLRTGGHCIVMENLKHHGGHMWANSFEEWQRKFEEAGFVTVAFQYYDYSPFLRAQSYLYQRFLQMRSGRALKEKEVVPETLIADYEIRRRQRQLMQHQLYAMDATRFISMSIDYLLEPMFIKLNLPLSTLHCGFLFRAV